ncbi:MAG: DUF134 domain-containing protein [Oscillospiraceae bacterium]|nr:DUF134 domain-containing protein [Oscillospiraceae bacterium]
MPRKQRCRWIGGYPDHWEFSPEEVSDGEPVVMSLDEFETVRLLDREGMTQEQCAERMGVARTTVTAIYESARRKIAEALVDGKRLLIRGGSYRLNNQCTVQFMQKGTDVMRIAVTYENGEIFQHFGHTEQFKLYDVEDGRIIGEQIVPTNGSGHGALAGFLKTAEVDALICGGIGMGAQSALAEAGIELYGGVQGSADVAAQALAEGRLAYDPNAQCDHHDHHHGEGHKCGHHHGEGHSCGHHHGDEGCRRHHENG